MLRINSIRLKTDYKETDIKAAVIKRLRIERTPESLISYKLVKKSVDARDKADIRYVLCVDVTVKNEKKIISDKRIRDVSITEPVIYKDPAGLSVHDSNISGNGDPDADPKTLKTGSGLPQTRPVIAGFGPAGMICAYKLAWAGLKPIVIERGLDVDSRKKKVEAFWNGGELDENTNVQFGEGGAGTFSDGKLSTMIHDKVGRIGEFFRILVENGADESILYNAKPHVGTDMLSVIVKNIRKCIIELGGEVRFGCRLNGIITDAEGNLREVIVEDTEGISNICTDTLVLAIGHSARDTFEMLAKKGMMLEQKPFAVGVRVQHPQELIGYSQYGKDFLQLPPADYKLTYNSQVRNRGVYSFCMCPGGFVVNSSSEKGRLVINGMSNSDRGEPTANSAIVVNVDRRDFEDDSWNAGVRFQRRIEELAYKECQGKIPVQKYLDFKDMCLGRTDAGFFDDTGSRVDLQCLEIKGPDTDLRSNYRPGTGTGTNTDSLQDKGTDPGIKYLSGIVTGPNTKGQWAYGNINNILPRQLCESILEAFPEFGRRIAGFDAPETLLMGVESRTSSPVRIVRGENLEAAGFTGIYPCGEGAGYAGGITSAAVDGIKVYEEIVKRHRI